MKDFTKPERCWIFYDWANSVYATNIMAAIFPIYFTSVVGGDTAGLTWWGYGTSIATLVVAIMSPIIGALGDSKGMKKKFWMFFAIMGIGFTLTMAIFENWQLLLVGYIFSYIGFSGANLFYDSFLTDVTVRERMDKVSTWGFAAGYVGGSTIAFLISIAFLVVLGFDNPLGVKISVVITAVWWFIFSIPMFLNIEQKYYHENPPSKVLKNIFSELKRTISEIVNDKAVLFFMIAYFCYIDGVGTVIHMATSYGTTLGLSSVMMILALLVTQVVAVPFSIFFGTLAKKFGSIRMIYIAISAYIVICIMGFMMGQIVENAGSSADEQLAAIYQATVLFWILAGCIGTVQGGIQALSRSQFGRMIDPEKSNEYFGFFDIFGKFATVIGPFLVAIITDMTGRASVGILSLIVLFALGLIFLTMGRKYFDLSGNKIK